MEQNNENANANPAEAAEQPAAQPAVVKTKKPWYKNGWVWTGVGVGVAAVAGVTVALCCKGKSKDVAVAAAPAAGEIIEQGLMAIL